MDTRAHMHTHAHSRRPARARRTWVSPRGRSSVYKSITTSPRVVSRRTAMAPASPQEQTPGNDRRSPRAAAPYVMTCATLVASSAGAVAPFGSATSVWLCCWYPRGLSYGLRSLLGDSASPLVTRIKACTPRALFYRNSVSIREQGGLHTPATWSSLDHVRGGPGDAIVSKLS